MSGQFHSLLSKHRTSVKTRSEELKLTRLLEILNVGRREMSVLDLLKELNLFFKEVFKSVGHFVKGYVHILSSPSGYKHQLVYLLSL